jgi:hypothetical protein
MEGMQVQHPIDGDLDRVVFYHVSSEKSRQRDRSVPKKETDRNLYLVYKFC